HDLDPPGFRWINCQDADASVASYLRLTPDESTIYLVVGHYTTAHRESYRVGVPRDGYWREVLNTNSEYYGGSGLGNGGGKVAQPVPADGHPQSLDLVLPPLTTTIFKWCPTRSEEHTSELQSRENLVCRL